MSRHPQTIAFLKGTVLISTSLSLKDVAERLSEALSIPLQEDIEGLYEEVPSYYGNTLGLRVVVMEGMSDNPASGQREFVLDIHPVTRLGEADFQEVDLSSFVQACLSDVSGLRITLVE